MPPLACSFVYLPLVMLQHSGCVVPIFILRVSYVSGKKKYTKLVCFFDIDVLIFMEKKTLCFACCRRLCKRGGVIEYGCVCRSKGCVLAAGCVVVRGRGLWLKVMFGELYTLYKVLHIPRVLYDAF